jgi:tetratricopeptide (TPR) repeat protein
MGVGRAVLGIIMTSLTVMGCASTRDAAGDENAGRNRQAEIAHQMALQHVIEGSINEMKGENAQAILEYQDALRFEKDPAIYYALARNYTALTKHALAIENAKTAVRLDPDNLDYRRGLAESEVAAFEIDAAAEQYGEIVKRDSGNIDAWYSLARLYQGRKPLQALEVYEQITARFGPEWEVLLQMADLCNKLGKFSKAAETLHQAALIDPSNQELQRSYGQALVRAGSYDSALAVFRELRERNPDTIEYSAEMAGVYLLQKNYDRAATEFAPILIKDSVAIEIKLHIGELYFAQLEKDSTLAPLTVSIFERIRDGHPEDWRAYWFLGAIGSVRHDDSLAIRNFRKVTELASWNPDAWVYLSSVFLGRNNFAEVANILQSALKVLPDDFRVNFFLGVAYSRLNRNTDAARVLEHARQINPKDVDGITQLALVYDALKNVEESDRLYEEALKLDPNNHLVLNNFSYSLAERGVQLTRALGMATKAVAAQPENPSYLDTMGWICYRLGNYVDAERYVKKAIAVGEVSAVVYEHLGDIYFRLNDRESALEQWNAALKLDETNTALREKITRGTL